MKHPKKLIVSKLTNVKHSGPSKLSTYGRCRGHRVWVGKGYVNNMIGVYIPAGTFLTSFFVDSNAHYNLEHMLDRGHTVIKQKYYGKMVDGIFLPLSCLYPTGADLTDMKVGDKFTELNGKKISVMPDIQLVLSEIFNGKEK